MSLSSADLYRELMAEMRWRRDTEFKLLTVHIAVSSAAVALVTQAQGKGAGLEILAPVTAVALVTTSWLAIRSKVISENKIYQYLGARVVRIWEEAKLFTAAAEGVPPFLEERSRRFGTGAGSKLTLRSLFLAWLATVLFASIVVLRTLLALAAEAGYDCDFP